METKEIPETLQIIFKRRSCRAFHPEPIPTGHLDLLVEALRRAPSAGNQQPWHFYLVKNNALKEKLVWAAYGQAFLAEAPVVFVVCALPERSAFRYRERGRNLYVYQDTAAAVENLLLAATALGYGSCWVGAFNEDAARQVLNLPADYRPVALVPVGKPAERPQPSSRLPVDQILTILE
ncbi:MAG: nitroreductase family protein [Calditrichia bacterium]